MTQFKVGDRVRYTGKQEMLSPYLVGKTATVTMVASDGYVNGLDWDDKTEKHKSCFAGNLELIQDDRLTRLESFVALVAGSGPGDRDNYLYEAKSLVAEIAPVDPDLAIAKEMAFDAQDDFVTPLASARLERLERHILCAIKRGRSLERGEP